MFLINMVGRGGGNEDHALGKMTRKSFILFIVFTFAWLIYGNAAVHFISSIGPLLLIFGV